MSALDDIVLSPDPRLREACAPVEKIDGSVRRLVKRMLRDMYAADGCGLAAPQVGELLQIVVIDVDYAGEGGKKNPYVLINPKIVSTGEETMTWHEGCLSFPGITVSVERPSSVTVHALDLDGTLMEYQAENNLLCVCLQHEIDHVQGVTMLDRLEPKDRVVALKNYQEALASGARPGDVAQDAE